MLKSKSFWIVVAVTVAVVVAAESGLRLAGERVPEASDWPTAESQLKAQQLEDLGTDLDVVILGSSVSEASTDPELVGALSGQSVHNSAMPFMSPAAYEVWALGVALEHASPRLIVIGLPSWSFDDDNDPLRDGLIHAIDPPLLQKLAPSSELVAHSGSFADWDRLTARKRLLESGEITNRGHQTGYYDRLAGAFDGLQGVGDASAMAPAQTEALRGLVDELKARGVDVVLVLEPAQKTPAQDRTAYIQWIKERAEEWEVDVWDMYTMDWAPSLFADEVHFNREGTVAYSRRIAELIAARS